MGTVLYNLAECLRIIGVLIKPFMPNTPAKIFHQLGIAEGELTDWSSVKEYGSLPAGTRVNRGEVIFPRLDIKKELESAQDDKAKKSGDKKGQEQEKGEITIEDFAKLDLRVAKVVEAEKVEGADKLLKLQLQVGDETRQVVSGIAKHYQPSQLIGKYVILVANLKSVKLRGVYSQGMILAASTDKDLVLATVDGEIDSGCKVT